MPLSTDETNRGDSASSVSVSYQLSRFPCQRGSFSTLFKVRSSISQSVSEEISDKSRAARHEQSIIPILVGEVRCATRKTGVSCTLSGGRKWLRSLQKRV